MSKTVPFFAAIVAALSFAAPAAADDAADIRARLEQWTTDFNEGRAEAACDLFSKELVSDFRGQGEAGYDTRCSLITKAIGDPSRKFHYDLEIKEIIVEGNLGVVRLVWRSQITPPNVTTEEPGIDIFRKEADGTWRIIRYMAFEAE
jgi:ketosteroid isomerase-like protein